MTSTLIINLAYIGSILFKDGILIRREITVGNIVHIEKGIIFGHGPIISLVIGPLTLSDTIIYN